MVPVKVSAPLALSAWAMVNSKLLPTSASIAVPAQALALLVLSPKADRPVQSESAHCMRRFHTICEDESIQFFECFFLLSLRRPL